MKKIIVLSFAFLLFSSNSCKNDKYIPPQDENGKICIQQLDNVKRSCEQSAQEDYKFCKKNKRKNCKLNTKVCNSQYKAGYVKCGGQVVRE